MSDAQKGEKGNNWKGDNINIPMIHGRVKLLYGEPRYCEICKSTSKKVYEWSNKDHSYRIPIKKEDWQRVCRSCHVKYDLKNNNRPNNYK